MFIYYIPIIVCMYFCLTGCTLIINYYYIIILWPIRILHKCQVLIDKSESRVTVWHPVALLSVVKLTETMT